MNIISKHHKLISAFISVSFIVVVQLFASREPIFRYLLSSFILFVTGVSLYNYVYLRVIEKYNFWIWLRPALFLCGWFGLFLITPNEFLRGLFLLVGLPIVFLFELFLGSGGEHLLFNEVLLTVFALYMAITAGSWYFINIHGAVYLLAVFIATALVCRSSFESMPQSVYAKWTGSLIIALFLTELFWALAFLPLHYSALGIMLFNIFYFCWALYYYYLFNTLTPKKIQFHIGLAAFITFSVLLVTPWKILS